MAKRQLFAAVYYQSHEAILLVSDRPGSVDHQLRNDHHHDLHEKTWRATPVRSHCGSQWQRWRRPSSVAHHHDMSLSIMNHTQEIKILPGRD
ncbi:hypothetical protein CEXT_431561 [Caerostris extrusa]|uniref:Uncharacterized protein n=1 Tax=Caerostris extrusa TaxID=172846 RepID=A0AAV4NAR3_CAEEX|nr:hypothetical protein CEXT_431561 [Caerostris extrusa]